MQNLDQLTHDRLIQLQQRLSDVGFYQVVPDGLIGPKTRAAWKAAVHCDFSDTDEVAVRRIQVHLSNAGFYTGKVDGCPGPRTRHAWRSANLLGLDIDPETVEDPRLKSLAEETAPPAAIDDPLSDKAVALILESEGLDQPGQWPGGASGVTIGIGYDLGYEDFAKDWKGVLDAQTFNALLPAVGKKGEEAHSMSFGLRCIRIGRPIAQKVFAESTIPKFEKQTEDAFPGMNVLPADAEGALVSLVYNRGPSTAGDRRIEMKRIHDLIANFDGSNLKGLQDAIADQFRAMKRLWVGKGLDGLLARRDAEANLVENAV